MALKGSPISQGVEIEADFLSTLVTSLREADPEHTTNDGFRQFLQRNQPVLDDPRLNGASITYFAQGEDLFLGNPDLAQVYASLEKIEQAPLRDTAAFLEEVIRRRESQEDLWPDGRLELGILYAALGEYRQASLVLDDVIQICKTGARYKGSDTAMAA